MEDGQKSLGRVPRVIEPHNKELPLRCIPHPLWHTKKIDVALPGDHRFFEAQERRDRYCVLVQGGVLGEPCVYDATSIRVSFVSLPTKFIDDIADEIKLIFKIGVIKFLDVPLLLGDRTIIKAEKAPLDEDQSFLQDLRTFEFPLGDGGNPLRLEPRRPFVAKVMYDEIRYDLPPFDLQVSLKGDLHVPMT